MPSLGVEYHVGVDGLGLLMVLLTSIVVPMASLASWQIEERAASLFRAGAAAAGRPVRHLHRAEFLPLVYFLGAQPDPGVFPDQALGRIAQHRAPRRSSSSTPWSAAWPAARFSGHLPGDGQLRLHRAGATGAERPADAGRDRETCTGSRFTPQHVALILFAGAFLGFAVKVPLVPFHTWLPAAYAEAPTGTTMLLTGAMSKMGVYGFLRILLPIFRAQMQLVLTPLLWLAVATIVLSAFAALAQKDLKRMFAYSSINHLGYCLLAHLRRGQIHRRRRSADHRKGRGAQRRDAADVQPRPHRGHAVLVRRAAREAQRRPARPERFRWPAQSRAGVYRADGDRAFLVARPARAERISRRVPDLQRLVPAGRRGRRRLASRPAGHGDLSADILQRVFSGPLNETWAAMPDLTTGERLVARARHRADVCAGPLSATDPRSREQYGDAAGAATEVLVAG